MVKLCEKCRKKSAIEGTWCHQCTTELITKLQEYNANNPKVIRVLTSLKMNRHKPRPKI
ncbi:MAG: hypothetical protein HPY81_09495 [Firmicutes bacterium]|nr:hypothetical protein [Bacillota bacterium]